MFKTRAFFPFVVGKIFFLPHVKTVSLVCQWDTLQHSHTDSCNLSPHFWALGPSVYAVLPGEQRSSGHSQSTSFVCSPLLVIKLRIGRSQCNPELWTNSRPRDLAENGCGSSHGSWGWGLRLFLFKSLRRLLPSSFSLMQTSLIPGYCR